MLPKKSAKCLNPTQGLPVIPPAGEKSLNAIWAPYMGA